jgi:competence protein ComEC
MQQDLAPYENITGSMVEVTGTISDDVDLGEGGELVMRLAVKEIDGHAISGSVWASVTTKLHLQRSDVVTLKGKLSTGFGGFAASMYRGELTKVQRPQPGDVALRVRDWFADTVRRAIPEPEASLGLGYLVGQRQALPQELDEALRVAGLTHVVVASGYNLTILVRLARRLFMRVSKFTAAAAAGSMVISFIAITGASPSMSRAGLVAALSLLAWYYGRAFHPLVLLPVAAAVTLLVNPAYGWGDLGWQLSFASFAGVMIVAPLLQRFFFGEKKPGTVRQILGETTAAQLCTLPIILVAFGQLSNVALVANILILPLVPLAMLLTFCAGIGVWLAPDIAELIGWPAAFLLRYMTSTAEWLAKLPWAQSEVVINNGMAIVLYGVLAVACVYMWRATKYNLRESNLVE